MVAFPVSFQLPLAAYGAGLLPAAAYGGAWRLRVSLGSGAVGAMLCRGRMPTAAAFRDWQLWPWLGPVSFRDTLPVSFAARLAYPLSVLAMAQRSPLFFAVAWRGNGNWAGPLRRNAEVGYCQNNLPLDFCCHLPHSDANEYSNIATLLA